MSSNVTLSKFCLYRQQLIFLRITDNPISQAGQLLSKLGTGDWFLSWDFVPLSWVSEVPVAWSWEFQPYMSSQPDPLDFGPRLSVILLATLALRPQTCDWAMLLASFGYQHASTCCETPQSSKSCESSLLAKTPLISPSSSFTASVSVKSSEKYICHLTDKGPRTYQPFFYELSFRTSSKECPLLRIKVKACQRTLSV